MRHRYTVLVFSLLLAGLVAMPAIGQSTDPTATTSISAKKLAKKANKKAKKALKRAKAAKGIANSAASAAASAQNSANAAQSSADAAQSTANSALTVGRSGYDLNCFGTADYTCASVTVDLPQQGRVLLVSQLPMHEDAAATSASCEVRRDGVAVTETETRPGSQQTDTSQQDGEIANAGVTRVTDVLPAGSTTFAQVCSDTGGNPHFRKTSISAVLLGAG